MKSIIIARSRYLQLPLILGLKSSFGDLSRSKSEALKHPKHNAFEVS